MKLARARLAPFRPPRFGLPRLWKEPPRQVTPEGRPPFGARRPVGKMRPTDFCNRHLDTSTRSDRSILESSRAAAFASARDFHAPRAEVSRVEPRFDDELPASARLPMEPGEPSLQAPCGPVWAPIESPPPCAPRPAACSAVGSSCEPASDTLCRDTSFAGPEPHEEEESPRPASAAASSKTSTSANQDAFRRRHARRAAFASPTDAARRLLQPTRSASTTSNRPNLGLHARGCPRSTPR